MLRGYAFGICSWFGCACVTLWINNNRLYQIPSYLEY